MAYQVGTVPLGLSLMYGAGLVSALLGIGSGVLKIPAMDTALRLPIKVSSATSNFMIGVTATASAGAYFVRGDIDAGIAGPVALGSVVGALAGARLLMGLSGDKLRVFFVIILALLAVADADERPRRAHQRVSGESRHERRHKWLRGHANASSPGCCATEPGWPRPLSRRA